MANKKVKDIEYTNTQQVTYNEGTKPRVDGTSTSGVPKRIGVRGRAVYRDADNIERPAVNARITCKVENESWTTQNRPDLAITQNSAITNSSGVFSMDVYFNDGLGLNSYVNGNLSIHKYDIMKLSVIYKGYPIRDDVNDKFYYLVDTM